MSYQLRDDDIVWDALSPENIVIADLRQGSYLTLMGEGSDFLWNLLINKVSFADILNACKTYIEIVPQDTESRVKHIIDSLIASEILVETPNNDPGHNTAFSNIKLNTFDVSITSYDDMQMLLQLDPIDNAII